MEFVIAEQDGRNLPAVPMVEFENRKRETLVICLAGNRPFTLRSGQRAKIPLRDLPHMPEADAVFESLELAGLLRRHASSGTVLHC